MTELDRFMRRPEVEQTIGLSTSTLYEMMAAGKFPKPIKMGAASRWSAREVAEWQLQKVAERTTKNGAATILPTSLPTK